MKIIFLGSQGSGKSTQAKLLAEVLKLPWIEMGQLFRDKSNQVNEDGLKIKQSLETGQLVPDEIAIKVLRERLQDSDCLSGYILDGYPRNYSQLKGLEEDIDKVFYVQVSDGESVRRLSKRAREDDTIDLIKKRLDLYHKQTEPLLGYFRSKDLLTETDGERPIEEIHEDIKKVIENEKTRK